MKPNISLYLACGVCWFNLTALPQEQPPGATRVIDYIALIGPRLGCYFTLEFQEPPAGRSLLLTLVSNDLNVASISQLTSKLRHDLEGYIVEQDSKNSKIVHIMERALETNKNYPLNKKITLKYFGNVQERPVWDSKLGYFLGKAGLIDAVSKEAPGVRAATESCGNWAGFGDYATKVAIDATNETVRSIFTDCIPATNYNHIIWEAWATEEAGKPHVLVLFYGPRKP